MSYLTRHLHHYLFFSLFITASLNSAYAAKNKDAPLLIPGTTKVFAEDIIKLAEKIPELLLIDARIPSDRKQGYIEGSISLPDINTNCASLAKIIPAKKTPVLFYCNGVKCGRSVKSSRIALKCGYNNIYWFRGGYEEWKNKKFPFIKK